MGAFDRKATGSREAIGNRMTTWPFRLAGGLQRALLLFVALPLIAVAGMGIRFGFDQANRFQETLLKNDLELIAQAISIPVGDALARKDVGAVAMALESVFTIDRVYGATVFDVNGERVASGGIAERDLTNSVIPERIQATGEKQEAYRRVAGRTVFSHFFPLFDGHGQSMGFIQITRRQGDFTRSLQQLTLLSWGVWGLLVLTIVVTVLVGHYGGIGRHVDKLIAAMAAVAGGDPDQRVSVHGPREVAALASGLNSMLDAIQHSERELEARRAAEHRLMLELKDNESMATIGRMARGFAHELGAPLSVIDGRARRLQRQGLVDSAGEREVEDIRRQVHHLTRTVRQLLDYSRPATRQSRRYPLSEVLERAHGVVEGEWQPGDPRLTLIPAETLISMKSPAVLMGDPDRLLLALLNVIRNALQAAHHEVVVSSRQRDGAVDIVVEDDGPGLPGVDMAQLVEPFYTTKASGEGTGLGLSITHSILVDQGGALALENAPDGGCRATLTLPCDNGPKAPADAVEDDRHGCPYSAGGG